MTPPQLTDAWSIAYLQILIVLFTVAFGIPSIIFQVTLPEDIRRLVNRYMKRMFLFPFITAMVLVLIFSLSFIWFLNPSNADCQSPNHWIGSIIVSLSLAFLIIFWWFYLRKLSREKIVNYLEYKLEKRFLKGGDLISDEMANLITLGERSDAGYEKEIVLKAIDKLMEKIQDSDRYSGNELDSILRNFDKIVTGKDKPGNESDFLLVVDILKKIIGRLSNKKFSNYGDEILVYWSLSEIGKKAAELRFANITLRIASIAASNSRTLFDIGLSAFNTVDYFVATTALSNLETLALETSNDEGQCANDLLGLLAHFWTGNRSSRRYSEEFLNSYENEFSPIVQYLDRAIEDHYSVSRFDTADKLMKMKDDLMGNRDQVSAIRGQGKRKSGKR